MSSSASHPPSDTAAEVPTRPWDGVSVTPEDSPGLVSTEEELNFVRLSKLLVRRVPEALRTLLKENWEEFQSRRKEPIDPALIAVTTYSRRHNRDRGANVYCRQMRGFQIQHEGQRKRVEKWEPMCIADRCEDFKFSMKGSASGWRNGRWMILTCLCCACF